MRKWWYSAGAFRQIAAGIAALLIAVSFFSSLAWARAVVFPTTSTPGAYEKYSLRIINERDVPTLRVEIHLPGTTNCHSTNCHEERSRSLQQAAYSGSRAAGGS